MTALTALALCTAACSRDPELAKQKYVASGDGYAAAGKPPEAIIEYRNAVDQDPRSADLREKLADTYARANEPAKAVDEYIRAADLQPDGTAAALKAAGCSSSVDGSTTRGSGPRRRWPGGPGIWMRRSCWPTRMPD